MSGGEKMFTFRDSNIRNSLNVWKVNFYFISPIFYEL